MILSFSLHFCGLTSDNSLTTKVSLEPDLADAGTQNIPKHFWQKTLLFLYDYGED